MFGLQVVCHCGDCGGRRVVNTWVMFSLMWQECGQHWPMDVGRAVHIRHGASLSENASLGLPP